MKQQELDKTKEKLSKKKNPTAVLKENVNKATDTVVFDDYLVKKFLEYIAAKLLGKFWGFELLRVGPNDGPVVPLNFISWLVVEGGDEEHRTLYILYNDLAINTGPRYKELIESRPLGVSYNNVMIDDKDKVLTRREKLILHEMGHAVNHLDWYRGNGDNLP